jgi:hypothetical protein
MAPDFISPSQIEANLRGQIKSGGVVSVNFRQTTASSNLSLPKILAATYSELLHGKSATEAGGEISRDWEIWWLFDTTKLGKRQRQPESRHVTNVFISRSVCHVTNCPLEHFFADSELSLNLGFPIRFLAFVFTTNHIGEMATRSSCYLQDHSRDFSIFQFHRSDLERLHIKLRLSYTHHTSRFYLASQVCLYLARRDKIRGRGSFTSISRVMEAKIGSQWGWCVYPCLNS